VSKQIIPDYSSLRTVLLSVFLWICDFGACVSYVTLRAERGSTGGQL